MPPLHSVIIPHRDRAEYLKWCLWSIHRSSQFLGLHDYRVLIVDWGGDVALSGGLQCPQHELVLVHQSHDEPFCKPLLQNRGISIAEASAPAGADQIFTFLDCDAIVGPQWLSEAPRRLADKSLTKLCYRARRLGEESLALLEGSDDPGGLVDDWLDAWTAYPNPFEAYGEAHIDWGVRMDKGFDDPPPDLPIFGNSQFSIRRDVLNSLGGLRFNEDYVGRGYEDLWMNREIARRAGAQYRAEIVTAPETAMFHIRQFPAAEDGWGPNSLNAANAERYANS